MIDDDVVDVVNDDDDDDDDDNDVGVSSFTSEPCRIARIDNVFRGCDMDLRECGQQLIELTSETWYKSCETSGSSREDNVLSEAGTHIECSTLYGTTKHVLNPRSRLVSKQGGSEEWFHCTETFRAQSERPLIGRVDATFYFVRCVACSLEFSIEIECHIRMLLFHATCPFTFTESTQCATALTE
jgi:hypothetical protein